MPEYLAPGVYVEETSFRSKSIEGVSTSTTGFAGPSRKGPLGVTPVLVTSFGDFQRIYGGPTSLEFTDEVLNHLALAARAYFDNGGSRLYVSRVFNDGGTPGAGIAASAPSGIRFIARFPGSAGNGTVTLVPQFAAATIRAMARAPQGTMVRTGTNDPQTPATIRLGVMPLNLPRSGILQLTVSGVDTDVPIRGEPVEVTAPDVLPAGPVPAATTLAVSIDGGPVQNIDVSNAADGPAVIAAINQALDGGYARLSGGEIVIGSDTFGTAGQVSVARQPALGFTGAGPASATGAGVGPGANTVPDRRNVGAADLNAALTAAGIGPSAAAGVTASIDGATGRLVLTTKAVGTTAHIAIRTAAATSLHAEFGVDGTTAEIPGSGAQPLQYFTKNGAQWQGPSGTLTWSDARNEGLAPVDTGAEFVSINVVTTDGDGAEKQYAGLGFASTHPAYIGTAFAVNPTSGAAVIENLFSLDTAGSTPFALQAALMPHDDQQLIALSGGTDGASPTSQNYRDAIDLFNRLEDISIVAAPGGAAFPTEHQDIQLALISHCEQRRAYRIAVLDTDRDADLEGAREERSRMDSTYAALYYPWVVIQNPLKKQSDDSLPQEIALPPSGFVCGIYARTDVERGVFKAPANEVVRGALRYFTDINFAEQQVLNPLGINCLRTFPNRGPLVWGSRTASSDPEWKYVPVRRYFNYLERSIDDGTQWAVFEPNGEALWANIRETIGSFLFNEWRSGALLGASTDEAYFVRCDRSTMDQNDLDNGRLVCLVGVAVVKPAEFVIFRIGQKTADASS